MIVSCIIIINIIIIIIIIMIITITAVAPRPARQLHAGGILEARLSLVALHVFRLPVSGHA